jgi:N-acylneuraminate cytidylyltransferase
MKSLAIIPARGGSKRIPRKNIRLFAGEPIIAFAIRKAIGSGLFDRIIVSTDDEEIAAISRSCGAEVPFLRTEKSASDTATTAEVLEEVLLNLAAQGETFDCACCIYPTVPLLPVSSLAEGCEKLSSGRLDAVISVCRFSHPVQRSLKITGETVSFVWPENRSVRSQDLEPYFHDAGQFYWFRTAAFLREKQLFMEKTGCVELAERYVQDIDNPEDWLLAELKHAYLQQHEQL